MNLFTFIKLIIELKNSSYAIVLILKNVMIDYLIINIINNVHNVLICFLNTIYASKEKKLITNLHNNV